jgi:acetyl-CoA synthetase
MVDGKDDEELYKIPERCVAPAHIKGMHNYLTTWEQSVDNVEAYWGAQAVERLTWYAPPKTVMRGSLKGGDIAWFPDGVLNVSVNCLDRHPCVAHSGNSHHDPERVACCH